MIVLVSLIVLLRGFPCFHDFSAWCIPTSIFIQLNDFCTCIYVLSDTPLCAKVGMCYVMLDKLVGIIYVIQL